MYKKIKVAINGFGRIGRAFFKLAQEKKNIEIVAVNDLADFDNLNYLLKYDSVYGNYQGELLTKDIFYNEPDPLYLPWKNLEVDIVVECTGVFDSFEKASAHIKAGAKRVVLSAPVKENKKKSEDENIPDYALGGETVLMGLNEDLLKNCQLSANGSCTTNAVSPVLEILNKKIGVKKAVLNTVHAYTSSQKLVDSPNKKDFRKGRAGAYNIIPTTTGAAIATAMVLKNLEGRFDGIATRVPVISGSLVDLTFVAKKEVSVEEINRIFEEASKEERWEGIFGVTQEPLVSSDVVANPYASLVDLSMTKVVDGDLVKVLIWYDNEMGYTNTLLKHVLKVGGLVESI